jgi:hypothetical protein
VRKNAKRTNSSTPMATRSTVSDSDVTPRKRSRHRSPRSSSESSGESSSEARSPQRRGIVSGSGNRRARSGRSGFPTGSARTPAGGRAFIVGDRSDSDDCANMTFSTTRVGVAAYVPSPARSPEDPSEGWWGEDNPFARRAVGSRNAKGVTFSDGSKERAGHYYNAGIGRLVSSVSAVTPVTSKSIGTMPRAGHAGLHQEPRHQR